MSRVLPRRPRRVGRHRVTGARRCPGGRSERTATRPALRACSPGRSAGCNGDRPSRPSGPGGCNRSARGGGASGSGLHGPILADRGECAAGRPALATPARSSREVSATPSAVAAPDARPRAGAGRSSGAAPAPRDQPSSLQVAVSSSSHWPRTRSWPPIGRQHPAEMPVPDHGHPARRPTPPGARSAGRPGRPPRPRSRHPARDRPRCVHPG